LGAKFPDIPVEPGIFSNLPEKCRVDTQNNKANQALASQFPPAAKREFIRAESGIK
jgi:hypothetical protein